MHEKKLQKEKDLQHSQVMNRVGQQISTSCIFGSGGGVSTGGGGNSGYLGNLDGRNSYSAFNYNAAPALVVRFFA